MVAAALVLCAGKHGGGERMFWGSNWRLLLAGVAVAFAGCSANPPQIASPTPPPQSPSRTIQCRDLSTGVISGHMGTAPQCDPGQEEVWSNRAGDAGSLAPRLAVVTPQGISFARYCYDTATLVARGSDSQCTSDSVELTSLEYRAIARKQINERITAYQIAGWPAHKEKPHLTPAQIVGTAVAISNGGVFLTRFSTIRGCTALSFGDIIAVDVEDDLAALISGARAGVVTSFRAAPPRHQGEPLLALAYSQNAGATVAPVHVAGAAESGGEVYATIDGAHSLPGNGALLLDSSGNTAGLVLVPGTSSGGQAKFLTAEGLAAVLDFWGLPYQTAKSVRTYPDDEVANWGKSMIQPVGCWRGS